MMSLQMQIDSSSFTTTMKREFGRSCHEHSGLLKPQLAQKLSSFDKYATWHCGQVEGCLLAIGALSAAPAVAFAIRCLAS